MGFKIDKVYTKSGDQGTTGLVGGKRVDKDNLRIESYGTVDELNSIVGMLRTVAQRLAVEAVRKDLLAELTRVQQQLFNVGSELATPDGKLLAGMPMVTDASIEHLEKCMDRWSESLKPLESFILPGGGEISAWAHIARTVCRRAERVVVSLRKQEPSVRVEAAKYLNRLSDWFFVLSRYAAKAAGEQEFLWDKSI